MKLLSLHLVLCLVCVVSAKRKDWVFSENPTSGIKSGTKLSTSRNPDELYKNFTRNDKSIASYDEAPWLACIVPSSGCKYPTFGFNGVFVSASWVLSNVFIVAALTNGGEKKKAISVISQTNEPQDGGVYHRVKDIVFEDNYIFALVKVSGEHHNYITLVPPTWAVDATTLHRVIYWAPYLDNIYYDDNILLPDQSLCMPPDFYDYYVCSSQQPYFYNHYMMGALLVNEDDQLVGLFFAASNGDPGYFEFFDRATYLYPWIRDVVTSSMAGNYENAK